MGRVRLWRGILDGRAPRLVVLATGRRSVRAAYLALICVMLAGCGRELRLVPPAGPSPRVISEAHAGAVATPVSTEVATEFRPIVWATAVDPATSAPIEPVASYRPDALRIIAAMQTIALSTGSVVEASWEYNNTSLDAFSTRLVPASSTAESWISFSIERSPDVVWPVGTYEVTVSHNGAAVQQASIEVAE